MKRKEHLVNENGNPSGVVIGSIAAILCVVIGCVTGLAALGRDTSQVIYLVVLIIAPTITSLIGLYSTDRIRKTQAAVATKVETIERNTNGNLGRLLDILEAKGVTLPPEWRDQHVADVANQTPEAPEPPQGV